VRKLDAQVLDVFFYGVISAIFEVIGILFFMRHKAQFFDAKFFFMLSLGYL